MIQTEELAADLVVTEALLLADGIIIVSDKPTRILRVIEVSLPRPRDLTDPRLVTIKSEMRALR